MARVFISMTVACICAALGQILVRRGMQQVGELNTWAPLALVRYFSHALTNPWVVVGTIGNAAFYFLFLAVLSWAEVTVALPLTALEYGVAAVLSMVILKEEIPPLRWAGIGLVVVGVMIIGFDQSRSERATVHPQTHKDLSHDISPH
jgi:drug/metabolite transporter (DMT)-like permease